MRLKENPIRMLQERYYVVDLRCGLSLYIMPKKGFRKKSGLLAVEFGSIDRAIIDVASDEEVSLPAGTAHFLEHRLFTKAQGDITDRFSRIGAEIDAHTTFTDTSFFFSANERIEECLELLFILAFTLFDQEDGIVREREIIAREIQLFADNPEWVSYFSGLQSVYAGDPLGTDIAGTLESIQGIDQRILEYSHRMMYHPLNMGLYIAGDVDVERISDFADGWLEKNGVGDLPPQGRCVRTFFAARRSPGFCEIGLPVKQSHLCLVFRDQRAGKTGIELLKRELALELALDILLGTGSAFYKKNYETGLLDAESFGFEVNIEPHFGHCLVFGDAQNPKRLEASIAEEFESFQMRGFDEEAFERFKRKAYGHLVQGFDDIDNCANMMYNAVSCGAQPFDTLHAYESLKIEDLEDCLCTCLKPDCYGRSLVKPLDSRSDEAVAE